jgi:glycosyltransferase involved in cell wall biosynthesis
VTPRKVAALAAALAALLRDPDLRARLGTANRERARREFDQARMFSVWHALWLGRAREA